MAGLPRVAEIVKNLSKNETGASEPEPSKAEEAGSQQPTEEAASEKPEPMATADEGQAKSPENRVPYDRFKEVNDKLKDAHEVIAGFERRFQALESTSASESDEGESTQAEPSLSDKIGQMIEDGEIGEGAAALMQELASKVNGQSSQDSFIAELQLERATKSLSGKIDTAIKDVTIHDQRGARTYLAQTLQADPNIDLKVAVQAWTDWESEYEKKVLERHGVAPKGKSTEAESNESSPPKRPGKGGGGGGSPSGGSGGSSQDSPMSLKQIRANLSKSRRRG